ncbi:MAG: type IV toxin-antitoxin system AbiEi family antitoxin domain-containing protein [Solirubrobacterales bacterium]
MGHKSAFVDARVARIADRQHGVVTLAQLEDVGLSRSAVAKRAARGQLHRVHHGVYAVGHSPINFHGWWMAAVLACGEGAVLSHGSAAALWSLLRPISGPIDVSVPTQDGREKRRGIRIHRCASLAPSDEADLLPTRTQIRLVTVRHCIPVTTVQRTIDDLHGAVPPWLVRRARRQAELVGWRLEGVEGRRMRSDLEEDFLRLCRRCRLSLPETNAKVGRWEVDFLWREERVVVETDSFAYHRGSVAFEDDHARDLDLRSAGFAVLRFTEAQLEQELGRVAEDVARALGREELVRAVCQ